MKNLYFYTSVGVGGWIASDPREQIKDTYYLFRNGAVDIINSMQEQTNKKEKK